MIWKIMNLQQKVNFLLKSTTSHYKKNSLQKYLFSKNISKFFFLVNLLLIFLFVVSTLAAEPVVRLSKLKIKKGEPLYLELDFDGKPDLNVPQKVITQNHVTLEYLGSQDNLSIINGNISQKRTLKFRVITSKDGKFQTPTFHILENGNPVTISSKSFEVSKEKYVYEPQNLDHFDSLFDRVFDLHKRRNPHEWSPEDIHIIFKVNKEKIYVGETIIGYYLFYLRDMDGWFLERNQQTGPDFPFFTSELLSNVLIDTPMTEEYKGITYNLFPYQREVYALTSLRKGKYKIGKTNFLLVDGGLETLFSQKSVDAEEAQVTVLDLPEPKPQNFSGEVGNYEIHAKLSQNQITLGESLQIELEISGYGTGNLFKDPLSEHCANYDCKARVSFLGEKKNRKFVKLSEGNYTFKTNIYFNYSVFPYTEGEINLGTLKINYFDPNQAEYKESAFIFPIVKVLPKLNVQETLSQEETKNIYTHLLLFLLLGSALFLVYNFREDLLSIFIQIKTLKVFSRLLSQNTELEKLDKLIGNKTGNLLKNYLLSKNIEMNLVTKILELKAEHPNKKMIDIYKSLKKEDKEELSKLIQNHFSKGEKL